MPLGLEAEGLQAQKLQVTCRIYKQATSWQEKSGSTLVWRPFIDHCSFFTLAAQIKCGCGIVLQQKFCQNGNNAGRPYVACPKLRDVSFFIGADLT